MIGVEDVADKALDSYAARERRMTRRIAGNDSRSVNPEREEEAELKVDRD